MRVYHGSDVRIDEIDLSKSGNFKDFGRGFYVTNLFKHAQSRAADIAQTNGTQPVEGAIADDWVTMQIDRYIKGKISTKKLIEKIKFRELTHQICFCTTESLFALELVDDDQLFEIEDISNAIIKKLSMENNLNELDAMKIFFNSKTYEKLTKSDNLSFAKDKKEIFESIKRELSK